MDISKKLKNDIFESHAKGDFASVHDLIPQYAAHIVDRIKDNDRIDDLKTDLFEFFRGNIFGLFHN